jgi:hypothetical protein
MSNHQNEEVSVIKNAEKYVQVESKISSKQLVKVVIALTSVLERNYKKAGFIKGHLECMKEATKSYERIKALITVENENEENSSESYILSKYNLSQKLCVEDYEEIKHLTNEEVAKTLIELKKIGVFND